MATLQVKGSDNSTANVELPLPPGRAAAGSSRPVALSNEDKATLDALNTVLGVKTDAKATATDGTAVTLMSVWKQVSASIQTLVTGAGTSGRRPVAEATTVVTPSDADFTVKIDPTQQGLIGPQIAGSSSSITPANTSDVTPYRVNSIATVNATSVKGAAGLLRSLDLFNTAAYTVYCKFYNKSTAPSSSDTPVWTIPIPAGSGFSKQWFVGMPFSIGIGYLITKNQADSDNTAVAAGDVTGNISIV